MNKQQLITQCREILAEAEYQEEWCVNMAAALLPCLEAEPVVVRCRYHPTPQCDGKWIYIPQAEYIKDETGKYQEQALYTAPPVPELKSVEFEEDEAALEKGVSALIDCLEDCGDAEQGLRLALRAMTGVE